MCNAYFCGFGETTLGQLAKITSGGSGLIAALTTIICQFSKQFPKLA